MTPLTLLLLVMVVAGLVATAAEVLRFPYTIALVLVGLVVGNLHLASPPPVSSEVLLTVLIPPLLFEGGLRLPPVHLRTYGGLILLLAVPGTAAAAVAIALAAVAAGHLDPKSSLLLGAAAAAIDPVSVIALMRELGVTAGLATVLEAEAVLNDGIAIVLFALAASHDPAAPLAVVGRFLWLVGAGAAAGLASAGAVAYGLTHTRQAHVEALGSLIAALGALVLADAVGASGVIAVAVSGVVFGTYGVRSVSEEGRERVRTLWDTIAFLANSILFLLVGLHVPAPLLVRHAGLAAAVVATALLVRAATIAFLALPRWPVLPSLPRGWPAVLAWSGLRGGVTIALALSVEATLPGWEPVVAALVGLVVFTLIVQGLSIGPLLRRVGGAPSSDQEDERRGRHGQ